MPASGFSPSGAPAGWSRGSLDGPGWRSAGQADRPLVPGEARRARSARSADRPRRPADSGAYATSSAARPPRRSRPSAAIAGPAMGSGRRPLRAGRRRGSGPRPTIGIVGVAQRALRHGGVPRPTIDRFAQATGPVSARPGRPDWCRPAPWRPPSEMGAPGECQAHHAGDELSFHDTNVSIPGDGRPSRTWSRSDVRCGRRPSRPPGESGTRSPRAPRRPDAIVSPPEARKPATPRLRRARPAGRGSPRRGILPRSPGNARGTPRRRRPPPSTPRTGPTDPANRTDAGTLGPTIGRVTIAPFRLAIPPTYGILWKELRKRRPGRVDNSWVICVVWGGTY